MPDLATVPVSVPSSDAGQLASVGGDNPQKDRPREQRQDFGISKDDELLLVETVTIYRGQWAPDRLARIPIWMKNVLFYRGSQVLAWDLNSGTWFDAVAWWKQSGNEEQGNDIYDERFICNLTQMFGVGFKGMMARGIPLTVVLPENAEILADVTTAKAAQEAIGIIERMNKIRQMVREEFETLYLMGTYFKYTRGVLDSKLGYDEEEIYGDVPVTRPDRYHCFNCGTDTPWAPTLQKGQARICPKCGAPLGPESFYPASTSIEMGVVGTQKVPRAMVKQTVHSPMEIDVDPNAKDLEATPLLAFDQEIDVGEARMMFPAMAAEISEGMQVSTSPNADYERLRRSEVSAAAGGFVADSANQRPTYSQNWLQPASYYRLGDLEFAQRMGDAFPDGLKLTLMGDKVVDIRAAILTKEWSSARLHEKFGLYSPSVADNVVPFNERFNDVMQKIDEWVGDSANGMNVIDGARIDKRAFNGKPLASGTLNEIPMKIHGEYRPLSDAFMHFDLPMEAQVFSYPQMLLQFCQLIACLPPQATGAGTLPGVDTKGGQEQMLSQASNALNIYWENGKEEHAVAAQNAIECLQKLMKAGALKEIWETVQENGSQYRNKYVDLSKMNGKVNVYADIDQGLPMSPEAVREVFQTIFKEAGSGNAEAQAIMDIQANSQQMMASLGTPNLVVPRAAQQAKTQQAINVLLEQDWQQGADPNGQPQKVLPILPDKYVDDFVTLKSVMRLFRQENSDLAKSNPDGWARLDAYYQAAEQMEMEVAVEDAGRKQKVNVAGGPPQQQPDANIAQAKQDLLAHAVPMIDQLSAIAMAPPLPKGASLASQYQAAKVVVDTALKVATA